MTAAATRVLFDEPGPRGRARIRIFTVIGLLLVAGLVALALYQFYKNGQLGRSRWLAFAQPAYLRFLADGSVVLQTSRVGTSLASFTVPGLTPAPGDRTVVRPKGQRTKPARIHKPR